MSTTTASDYRLALDRLLSLPDYERGNLGSRVGGVPFNLERPRALLAHLGNPQLGVPTVLIAGSKGKGSTAAILESLLRAHGFRTLLYTQPHLNDYRERIRVDGQLIGETEFTAWAGRVADAAALLGNGRPELGPATTYEETTALAMLAARELMVDWCVLEVGLGGRLDATNLSDPLVSVLTPVGLEHQAILGDSIAAIATEKSAIFRPRRPAVVAGQSEEAMVVARRHARAIGSRLVLAPGFGSRRVKATARPWDTSAFPGPERPRFWSVSIAGKLARYTNLELSLGGDVQVSNLATAISALECLPGAGSWIDAERVRRGVSNLWWPGRFETAGDHWVLDGAHTVESVQALVRALRIHLQKRRISVVFACLEDKPAEAMLRHLGGVAERLVVTRSKHPRSRDPEELASIAAGNGLRPEVRQEASDAFVWTRLQLSSAAEAICVTGSLSIVGQAREFLGMPVR